MDLPPITIYRSAEALIAQRGEDYFKISATHLDALFAEPQPASWLHEQLARAEPTLAPSRWLAPIENQEVWAAGVTYLRSRDARMEESQAVAVRISTTAFTMQSGPSSFLKRLPIGSSAWTEKSVSAVTRNGMSPSQRWRLRSISTETFSATPSETT